mmetsp:Transcript_13308/g.34666  ORF Transcript_13308/g.34666 Transcript_13308/m.34666 type:complete len:200 (+) Transcript_13308:256-855(+)
MIELIEFRAFAGSMTARVRKPSPTRPLSELRYWMATRYSEAFTPCAAVASRSLRTAPASAFATSSLASASPCAQGARRMRAQSARKHSTRPHFRAARRTHTPYSSAHLGAVDHAGADAFRLQHELGCIALAADDRALAIAVGLQDHRTALALRDDLCLHRRFDVARRQNVLHLDARDHHAPPLRIAHDGLQQLLIDAFS